MVVLSVVLVAVAVGLAVWSLASQAEERSTIRTTLRRLDGYDVASTRDQDLLNPVKERAIDPILGRIGALWRKYTPVGYIDGVRDKMVRTGDISADSVDTFMVKKVVGIALIPVAFLVVFVVLGMSGFIGVALFGFFGFALFAGPDAILNRKVEDRQHQIRIGLPDVLDILVISVEAGLGFEQALARTVESVPGPLSDEFSRMLGEVRAGSSRADAMRAMEKRLDIAEVRSFILAILQADTFGVSIGRVLRAQAEEMRIKRRQMAQEAAQKAPVKMLIPMVFCIFPAIFVVVLGPAVINISQNFS